VVVMVVMVVPVVMVVMMMVVAVVAVAVLVIRGRRVLEHGRMGRRRYHVRQRGRHLVSRGRCIPHAAEDRHHDQHAR
jgi:hypothetical protein